MSLTLKLIGSIFVLILLSLLWMAWPVYGFYAHRGAVPMVPIGWVTLPDGEAPAVQEALDPGFQHAGDDALARMSAYRAEIGAPAMSAAVAIGGEVVWRGAVGWADIRSGRPATPDTIFRVGSTSKAITATALARLVDRGIVNLDAPISSYFDDLPNQAWAEITPRQLASHMSGLPHYELNSDWVGLYRTVALQDHYANISDALDIFDESQLLSEPGTEFYYSTLGTVLLGATMSEAAGIPYRQIVAEEVIDPLDLGSIMVAPARSGGDLATFYYREGERYRPWRRVDLSHRLPGGGWAATPSDLAQMGIMHLNADYITAETREAFWTPQQLSNGETNEQDYAVGWRWREWDVEGVGISRNANHGGVSRGSQAWLLVFPEFDMAIAITMNANTEEFAEFGLLFREILQAFAPAPANDEVAE